MRFSKFAQMVYSPGYDENESLNQSLLEEAAVLAAEQDAVIIFVGTTEKIESEGYDRKNLIFLNVMCF